MKPSRFLYHLFIAIPLTVLALGPVLIFVRLVTSIIHGEGFTMDCVMAGLGTVVMLVTVLPIALLSGNLVDVNIGTGMYVSIAATFAGMLALLIWRDFRSG